MIWQIFGLWIDVDFKIQPYSELYVHYTMFKYENDKEEQTWFSVKH